MQAGQAAKSKAMIIGRTPKLAAITTPLSLPMIFAVLMAVNLPKESLSLLIVSCHITMVLRLTLVNAITKQLHICWPHICSICCRNGSLRTWLQLVLQESVSSFTELMPNWRDQGMVSRFQFEKPIGFRLGAISVRETRDVSRWQESVLPSVRRYGVPDRRE